VFRGGRLLSVGLNNRKTNPRNLLYAYMGRFVSMKIEPA
jgi:hypothetical protein